MEAYFKKADELISTGQIDNPKYSDYVANATQTVKEVSKGKVDIKL